MFMYSLQTYVTTYVCKYVCAYVPTCICVYVPTSTYACVRALYVIRICVYVNKEVYKNLHFTPSIITVMFVLASTSFTIKNNTYNKLNSEPLSALTCSIH